MADMRPYCFSSRWNNRWCSRGNDYLPNRIREDTATIAEQNSESEGMHSLPSSLHRFGKSELIERAQLFDGPWDCVKYTVREKGFTGLYRGLSALVLGTSTKAGIRFLSFEHFKKVLADDQGKLSSQRMMLGMGSWFLPWRIESCK